MDESIRELERTYHRSHLLADLEAWLHALARGQQLAWWDATKALQMHYYGDLVPSLVPEVGASNLKGVKIMRTQGSHKTRPDGYYSVVCRPTDINTQSDKGLYEAIPQAIFVWGKSIYNLTETFRQALIIQDRKPLHRLAAQENYLPIEVVSLDDVRIMDGPISTHHLSELIKFFENYRIPPLMVRQT